MENGENSSEISCQTVRRNCRTALSMYRYFQNHALVSQGRSLVFLPTPPERDIENRAGFLDAFERLKGFVQNCSLLSEMKRLTQWMSKGPFQKNRAGWFDFFTEFSHDGNADRGNSGLLDFTLDQSDRLVADASARHQKRYIHLLCFKMFDDRRCALRDQSRNVQPIDMSHQTIKGLRQTPNLAFVHHLS